MSRNLTERTARRRWVRRVAALAIGGVALLTLSGCSHAEVEQLKRLGLPPPATDRAPYMSSLWIGGWIAAFAVGALVWGLIIYAVIRFRRRSDDETPRQVRYNLPIEMLYTVVPVIIVAVFFFYTVQKQDKIKAELAHPDHVVLVTGQQWAWTFSYLHESAVNDVPVYDSGNPVHLPELWLVKGQSVRFHLHSPDVIHSFWVPSFYFKLDVIPGRDQSFSVTPTRYGTFIGRCAELCGVYHSQMLFHVHVVDQATFAKHLRALKTQGHIGALRGGIDSHTVDGLESDPGGEQQ